MLDSLVKIYCKWLPFKSSVRYWILLISILTMTFIYANITAFNFTIICMLEPEEGEVELLDEENLYFDYSPIERNGLFSATAVGALASSVLFAFSVDKFGIRNSFVLFGIVSTLGTLLIPISAQIGYLFLFIVRIVQGTALPAVLTMVSSVSKEWSPTMTMGSYILLLSTPYQFGPIFTMPIAGELCESRWGWPSVYYLQGTVTMVLLTIFYLFFRDSPDSPHPCVNQKELSRIQHTKITSKIEEVDKKIPYKRIFKDPVVWITFLAFFGDELGYVLFLQYGPIFLNKVLDMDVRDTGFAAALPFIVSLLMKLMVGQINDRMTSLSDGNKIKMFSIISQSGTISCFILLATIPITSAYFPIWVFQAAYTAMNMFGSLAFVGSIKSAMMISCQFSHVLMAGTIFIGSAITLLLPLAINIVAPGNTIDEWSRIFIAMPCIQAVTISIFLFTCDSQPRSWTYSKEEQEKKKQIKANINV